MLYDYAKSGDDPAAAKAARELVVVRNNQGIFNEVVEGYLRRLDFGDDGYARLIHLPAYEAADVVVDVVVDPMRGFGQPIFARGGARIEDALSLFRFGEPLEVVAEEYGIPPEQLEDAVRKPRGEGPSTATPSQAIGRISHKHPLMLENRMF